MARIGAVIPVTNEQERRKARQLPEHQHQQQILGQHHPEHGAHEQQEEAEESPHRVLLRQVIASVENDQKTDTENQQGEEEAQSIKAQAQVESELRQPLVMDDFGLAGKYVGPFGQQQNQRCQWRQARAKGTSGATKPLQEQRQEDAQKWQSDDQRKRHERDPLSHLSGGILILAGTATA